MRACRSVARLPAKRHSAWPIRLKPRSSRCLGGVAARCCGQALAQEVQVHPQEVAWQVGDEACQRGQQVAQQLASAGDEVRPHGAEAAAQAIQAAHQQVYGGGVKPFRAARPW